jgi:hypothetical protein
MYVVEGRCEHRVLVGRPEGRIPLGRPRCRWKDNIKIDLQEVGGDGANSGYGQVAGTCGYGNELSGSINAGNFLTSCKTSYLLQKNSAPWSE